MNSEWVSDVDTHDDCFDELTLSSLLLRLETACSNLMHLCGGKLLTLCFDSAAAAAAIRVVVIKNRKLVAAAAPMPFHPFHTIHKASYSYMHVSRDGIIINARKFVDTHSLLHLPFFLYFLPSAPASPRPAIYISWLAVFIGNTFRCRALSWLRIKMPASKPMSSRS
jgi:hypothetical protein